MHGSALMASSCAPAGYHAIDDAHDGREVAAPDPGDGPPAAVAFVLNLLADADSVGSGCCPGAP